ncbi:thioredoxin family protein [Sporosarcina thermotolerans]|uniref:Thioredoxin family protein n=1 Tax=Sporosarcina thermotolerans TaxID=633404 RepID=A0AAW9ABB6_9BACL|nr:thioredoxin family protein [Sporosarcina thermotolerans]MDW0118334.1 thioredoxin family protein [Sporosarcina thermotolerans]WHT49388.1 thioredoxin family protein [Sporosarcina thermotolerans]
MKKLFIIGGVIIAIFALIVVLSNQSDKEKLKNNPYGKDDLKKPTIALIGNENYSNIVLPDELYDKVSSGESVTAYFFHPECQYCMAMTPLLMPVAKEENIHVYQFNMLEFGDQSQPYGIQSWPALIHYKDGKEVKRMVGLPEGSDEDVKETIRTFFDEYDEK